MSQYNAQTDSAAEYAGWETFAPELAPFLPAMDQSGGWNTPAHTGAGQMVGNKAALPPNVGSVSLHAKAGSTGASWVPRTCIACSDSFPNNYQLEQHATKNKHKAYVCICGKGFAKLSALRRHIEESTQARKHKCPLCDNEFKRQGHVEQHLRLIHNKAKDKIKDLLSAQKSQLRQESGQASTASTVIPAGPTKARVDQPVVVPEGPWTGPIDFSAPAPANHPDSRPGNFSTFFSGLPTFGTGIVPETPAFTPQSFMLQAADQAYPAYQTSAVANQTSVTVNTTLGFVGCPAAHPAGDLDLSNVDPALVTLNRLGSFGVPDLENDFMGEGFDFDIDLNSFDF